MILGEGQSKTRTVLGLEDQKKLLHTLIKKLEGFSTISNYEIPLHFCH